MLWEHLKSHLLIHKYTLGMWEEDGKEKSTWRKNMQQSVSWGYDLLIETKRFKKPPVRIRFLILKPCHTGVYFLLILI